MTETVNEIRRDAEFMANMQVGRQRFVAQAYLNLLDDVAALVEAASNAKSWIENYPLNADHEGDWIALTEELREALAKLEGETT